MVSIGGGLVVSVAGGEEQLIAKRLMATHRIDI
jgi:hypothetical protein